MRLFGALRTRDQAARLRTWHEIKLFEARQNALGAQAKRKKLETGSRLLTLELVSLVVLLALAAAIAAGVVTGSLAYPEALRASTAWGVVAVTVTRMFRRKP